MVYTGDSCACPKSLSYAVDVPPSPIPPINTPKEYGYKLEVPVPTKAKVTCTFDFTVQGPKITPPIEQEKWDLYAKIDRITAHRKGKCQFKTGPIVQLKSKGTEQKI